MAGKLSDSGADDALRAALGIAPSASRWLALCSSAPTSSTLGTELSGSGYARQPVTFGAPAAVGGVQESLNTNLVAFGPFGAIMPAATHVMVMDSVSASGAANMKAYAALDTARTAGTGDSIDFAIGSLDWTLA